MPGRRSSRRGRKSPKYRKSNRTSNRRRSSRKRASRRYRAAEEVDSLIDVLRQHFGDEAVAATGIIPTTISEVHFLDALLYQERQSKQPEPNVRDRLQISKRLTDLKWKSVMHEDGFTVMVDKNTPVVHVSDGLFNGKLNITMWYNSDRIVLSKKPQIVCNSLLTLANALHNTEYHLNQSLLSLWRVQAMPKDGKKTLRIETDFVLQHIEADRELKWKRALLSASSLKRLVL